MITPLLKEYSYGGTHKWLFSLFQKRGISQTAAILDIGSGSGVWIKRLQEAGYSNIAACDGFLSPDLSVVRFEKLDFNTGKLPFEDESIDFISLIEVIEHLENPNALVFEMHRVLKKGGTALISTPNVYTLVGRILFFFTGHFIGFLPRDAKFDGFPGHITPFFLHQFRAMFSEKFLVKQVNYSDFIVPFFGWHLPIRTSLFGNTLALWVEKR